MKNFFSNYDFEKEVSFKSKVDTCGFSYPKMDPNKHKKICKAFRHEHYDNEIPMLTPIFENALSNNNDINNSENSLIDFVGNVKLMSDYSPEIPIVISNTTATVNLNGKKITAPIFAESNGEVTSGNTDSYGFWVKNGAELTIEGQGEVIAQEAKYSMAIWANGGKVTIKDGIFRNNGNNSDLIYASNGSVVEIFGGEFFANENKGDIGTKNQYPALNIKDKDRNNTHILVYGGKFHGFNPANNLSEGKNTNFVAEGYESIEIEPNVWQVVAKL